MTGAKLVSGLARYCNDSISRNNVTFAPKLGTVRTWGICVLPETVINPGDEIFLDYGREYWEEADRN